MKLQKLTRTAISSVWPYVGGNLTFFFFSQSSLMPESFNGSPTSSINLVSALFSSLRNSREYCKLVSITYILEGLIHCSLISEKVCYAVETY